MDSNSLISNDLGIYMWFNPSYYDIVNSNKIQKELEQLFVSNNNSITLDAAALKGTTSSLLKCLGSPKRIIVNRYKGGSDYENVKLFDFNSSVAILTIGTSREIAFTKIGDSAAKYKLELSHGDLIVISPDMSSNWKYLIPKKTKIMESHYQLIIYFDSP